MCVIDGLADVRVPQQQGHSEVALLTSQRRAHRRAEGAAAKHHHLVCALQHRQCAAAHPSTLQVPDRQHLSPWWCATCSRAVTSFDLTWQGSNSDGLRLLGTVWARLTAECGGDKCELTLQCSDNERVLVAYSGLLLGPTFALETFDGRLIWAA